MLLLSLVPHRQIKNNTREESAFCHAQNESCDKEARHVLCDAEQGRNYSPGERERRKPQLGRRQFQYDIARYLYVLVSRLVGHWVTSHFKQDIANEVKSQAGEVLISSYCALSNKPPKSIKISLAYSYASRSSNLRLAHLQLPIPSATLKRPRTVSGEGEYIPLLRSRKDKRYNKVKAGNNLRSSFRSKAFSSTPNLAPRSSLDSS